MFQLCACHSDIPQYNSSETFRNVPLLLSHVCPAALSFDGYCQTPAWHHQLISNRFLYFPISGTLLALYIVYLAVLFFQSTSAKKRRGSTSRSTRTVNPKLGSLGSFGFAGFLGFWTYRVDQAIFPFVFFVFFGFFGFFYEGKMSNTLIDERYKENKMRAQSTANKTALSIIFLQY